MKRKLSETVQAVNAGIKRVGETLLTPPTSRKQHGEPQIEQSSEENGGGNHGGGESDSQTDRRERTRTQNERLYLSPEEKVIRHLSEQSDGRAWQTAIVDEMAWSASKTSRVLSAMEEHGRVLRYRIGKQKCVYLPGSEPDIIKNTT